MRESREFPLFWLLLTNLDLTYPAQQQPIVEVDRSPMNTIFHATPEYPVRVSLVSYHLAQRRQRYCEHGSSMKSPKVLGEEEENVRLGCARPMQPKPMHLAGSPKNSSISPSLDWVSLYTLTKTDISLSFKFIIMYLC